MFQTVALIAAATALADSSSARWSPRPDNTVSVWIQPASTADEWDPKYVLAVREAFREWSRVGLPLQFVLSGDSVAADLRVLWTDRFDRPMSGSTTMITVDNERIAEAVVELAVHHPDGRQLPMDEMRALALHEIGHALGLPHANDPRSVMAPVVRVHWLTATDRAAARRLYNVGTSARH